ncbi:protein-tyrosine phosphatase domain-containing protein [Ditylenchus destructor]|nr:protein-tyrosine phosphatase domain-containing protein [Ditylenchus destructor]
MCAIFNTVFFSVTLTITLTIVAGPTENETQIKLSNELQKSLLELEKYLKNDCRADFERIPKISGTKELMLSGEPFHDKDRFVYPNYKNIYKEPRVKFLDQSYIEGNICGDYINASPIDIEISESDILPTQTLHYIAAMAPAENGISDIWQLVWDHSVPIIVMLTDSWEGDGQMSAEYWPSRLNHAKKLAYNKIKFEGRTAVKRTNQSQLEVTMTDDEKQADSNQRHYGNVRKFIVRHTKVMHFWVVS